MIETGENVVNTTLQLRPREEEEEEGRRSWSLTVPDVVKRRGRLVCRTNINLNLHLHLNTRVVMEPLFPSLNLTVSTETQEAQHFSLTLSLESIHSEWEMISETR